MIMIIAVLQFIFSLFPHTGKAEIPVPVSPYESVKEYEKLIEITLSELPDGVTGMKSIVFINATPHTVWKVLTDYNNLKRYIPRMVESDLVAEKGTLKVIDLIGEFRVLLFKKTIRVSINMREKFPYRIDYDKISGDFEVYKGSWILQPYSIDGTILTYESEIKPSFVAPKFILQGILNNDMVAGLTALKGEAERLQAIELGNSPRPKK
jgi:ribosome-associated toxin RatA of RatAB toxin-antitoxin module